LAEPAPGAGCDGRLSFRVRVVAPFAHFRAGIGVAFSCPNVWHAESVYGFRERFLARDAFAGTKDGQAPAPKASRIVTPRASAVSDRVRHLLGSLVPALTRASHDPERIADSPQSR